MQAYIDISFLCYQPIFGRNVELFMSLLAIFIFFVFFENCSFLSSYMGGTLYGL